jgi:hypothetical protein
VARPKEFDREVAVERAISVFWSKGYAATSTDDLLAAMKITHVTKALIPARGDAVDRSRLMCPATLLS